MVCGVEIDSSIYVCKWIRHVNILYDIIFDYSYGIWTQSICVVIIYTLCVIYTIQIYNNFNSNIEQMEKNWSELHNNPWWDFRFHEYKLLHFYYTSSESSDWWFDRCQRFVTMTLRFFTLSIIEANARSYEKRKNTEHFFLCLWLHSYQF